MIDRKRVGTLAQQATGFGRLEAFLDSIEPELGAIEAEVARMEAMFDQTTDPIARFPLIGIGVDWFRLREDVHQEMRGRAVEVLRQLAQHRAILEARDVGRRNRKVDARHRALLDRLERARGTLEDFIKAIGLSREWIQNVLPALLPELGNGLGCLVIHVTP
jgi:hypothetical protein